MLILPEQLQGDVAELLDILAYLQSEDTAISEESLIVVLHLEDEELLPVGIPVCADSLEDPGAVVERIGSDADLGFVERDELIVHECKRRHRHVSPVFRNAVRYMTGR